MCSGRVGWMIIVQRPAISISSIIRTRISSIIYKNYIEIMEGMGPPDQRLWTSIAKVWRVGYGRKM
jgi:hypothetical protein